MPPLLTKAYSLGLKKSSERAQGSLGQFVPPEQKVRLQTYICKCTLTVNCTKETSLLKDHSLFRNHSYRRYKLMPTTDRYPAERLLHFLVTSWNNQHLLQLEACMDATWLAGDKFSKCLHFNYGIFLIWHRHTLTMEPWMLVSHHHHN